MAPTFRASRGNRLIKLKAEDGEDMAVISAQMQDALIRFQDLKFEKTRRQFAFISNRYAWDAAPEKQRRRNALHFENVLGARYKGFSNMGADTVLSLLAIGFEITDKPSGVVTLTFSGGHTVALDVEYLSCFCKDLGPAWSTQAQPKHET